MDRGKDEVHMMKLLGAVLVVLGCGSAGFACAAAHRYQVQSLQQLIRAIEYMDCDLQYQMTPLPDLCNGASTMCTGCVKAVFQDLGTELGKQAVPNATACMHTVILNHPNLQERMVRILLQLGDTLGRFDLRGQVQGLESVKKQAEFQLEQLRANQDVRLRNYQTLGLCAGAALVVLFL